MQRFRTRAVALALTLTLIASACGDDGDDDTAGSSGSSSAPSGATASTTTAAPKKGGSVTFGTFAESPGLDPVLGSAAGTTGGNELAALYDRMINWDPIEKKYTGRTVETFSANANFTEFTFKLRANIKFTDGTPYDAAAVKFNFDRQKEKNAIIRGPLGSMKEVAVVDPLTVKVTLNDSWPGFLTLVANTLGMIASPTAIGKLGTTFPVNPVGAGAGPFELVSFKPKESMVLKRNATYWGGEVYLDEVKFVNIVGAQATYDALKTGTLDMAFLREPQVIANAKKDKYAFVQNVMSSGEGLVLNHGVEATCTGGKPEALCAGKADGTKVASDAPGKSKKVRQALQLAIDPKIIDQRANGGTGRIATSFLDELFTWNPKVDLPKPDVEQAKKLVAEAKSEGWNGKIRLSCTSSPVRQATALAIQTQLQAVGIEVDMSRSSTDQNQLITDVITNKNFDMACWGIPLPPDDWAVTQADSFLRSTSGSNRGGYKNPAMDTALDELKRAATDAAKVTAWGKIAKIYGDDAVAIFLFHAEEIIATAARVQGARPSAFTTINWDKVWVTS
jgi:peptide/nickel transport system substrate-binding protein